jgi:hypothetical protein
MDVAPKVDVLNVPREADRILASPWLTDPRQRAIVENFRVHAMLEVSGRWEDILSPELTVRHPVYVVSEGDNTETFDGMDAVRGFYGDMTNAGLHVLVPITERMAVSDWGISFESLLSQTIPGHLMHIFGESVPDESQTYVMTSRVSNVWPYDENAKLLGENVYVDQASKVILPARPEDVVTPEIARKVLEPILAASGYAPLD